MPKMYPENNCLKFGHPICLPLSDDDYDTVYFEINRPTIFGNTI